MNHQDLYQTAESEWHTYIHHPFVMALAQGTLPEIAYLHYLQQDFLFLKHYARAHALAIVKADNLSQMKSHLPSLMALLDNEIFHHVQYCAQWGLSLQDMENQPESVGTVAYTRFVMDCGFSGDHTDLLVALAPCGWGYADIGRWINTHSETQWVQNPFQDWIDLYRGDGFQHARTRIQSELDRALKDIPLASEKGQKLCHIFKTATQMEAAFWQQSLDATQQHIHLSTANILKNTVQITTKLPTEKIIC